VSVSLAADACAPLVTDPSASALLLDLDGTLAPIVARPQDAKMIAGARESLICLRGALGLVAFVSGRGLNDLERIVGLPGCAYAGNHGFEVHPVGGSAHIAAAARPWLPVIDGLAAQWTPEVLDPAGLTLETKGATFSVHWRMAPDHQLAEDVLRARLAPDAERAGLVVTWGRLVMEVRPPVPINKGTATRELLASDGLRNAAYIGDDRTDVDAWHALRGLRDEGSLDAALAVAVASAETSEVAREADVVLENPAAVRDLLALLAERLTPAR
jgi:trehalose 6-phosphate phosphatase